ncbi:hypothetical protein A3C87_01925 [Candidatus Kaiserbacteria bacterium RIFCSPHIGHO2_02_FULL_49_34]|uniref:Polymer-forming cytoskeletal protein n=1 Tax=Candidatus Kaiserbacteria bacterium RIFCSPHIGHO2_02_FULL_49_34 TaxID=1798491 RepID=A0A1F6DI02_9BACT|nr:MAG: hypothetical protein A3C87_01925 [Candidatus Kaiserbacteria bacterium RIFCSPHIGHO2_02_FULL_49_34]
MMRFFTLMYVVVLCAPLAAHASPIIRVADTITLGATELVQGDWYSAGGVVTLSGSVNGDAYVAAGTVTINAPVKEDAVILGGAVRINADVGDDVRVVGGDVVITGTVGGDVIIIGGTLHIADTAKISGDVIVMAESVTVEGAVAGDIFARVSNLTLNAVVHGNVRAPMVHTLTLEKTTDIRGTLTYSSPSELVKADTAAVTGEITYTKTVIPGIDLADVVWTFFTILLLAAAVQGVLLKKLQQLAVTTHSRKGTAALVGIGAFLATPLLALLLFVLGITAPIGGITVALFVVYVTAAFGFATVLLGLYAYRFHNKILLPTWRTTLIGAILATVLVLIVPFLAFLAVITIPLGVLVLETYRTLIGKGR